MQIYQPNQSFVAAVDGVEYSFTPQTLVEEGHPILRAYPELFQEVHIHLRAPQVEDASASPGETRKK
ncbi:MAG TPA: hypothetical protein VLA89_05130 [Gemmatimonadales bacterium]|nr:hypothetical protein [Gemmatimonadales bacterium]